MIGCLGKGGRLCPITFGIVIDVPVMLVQRDQESGSIREVIYNLIQSGVTMLQYAYDNSLFV
jgi:hypothetical protein